jgi:hypothetical protein
MTQSFDCQSVHVMIIFNDPIRIALAQIPRTAPAAQCGGFSLLAYESKLPSLVMKKAPALTAEAL